MRLKLTVFSIATVLISLPMNGRCQQEPSDSINDRAIENVAFAIGLHHHPSSSEQAASATEQSKNGPQKPPWWDASWATWALVVVGFFGTVAAICTLRAINSQVTEMKSAAQQTERLISQATTNANAALLNAKAVLNSERAWILCDWEKVPNACHFSFRLKNYGRSPAIIEDVTCKEYVTEILTSATHEARNLQPQPDYGVATAFQQVRVLPPGKDWSAPDWDISDSDFGEVWDDISSGKRRLYRYGVIRYRDVLEGSEPHTTGFCYLYSYSAERFIIFGPSAYTYYT